MIVKKTLKLTPSAMQAAPLAELQRVPNDERTLAAAPRHQEEIARIVKETINALAMAERLSSMSMRRSSAKRSGAHLETVKAALVAKLEQPHAWA
ncbi:MAG: hypothetical protein ACRD6N_01620 [Pyrinomonadaceae bacterium]